MHIKVLGPVEVEHDGAQVNVGGPRQRRLLAVLLIQRGPRGAGRSSHRSDVARR